MRCASLRESAFRIDLGLLDEYDSKLERARVNGREVLFTHYGPANDVVSYGKAIEDMVENNSGIWGRLATTGPEWIDL